ncbi:hypothetical protein CB0940_04342 [Cercospora beticola]|uniref:Uncharacterized protein n=1 Tax=Cercospora beticola TaxID=122368 RepID=A0A2G5HL78_CERBT|nr:hypothetical protein CB0940_04342 [Cercospora beticola]PIA92972.1 hypothetical protein CB0940_04342 [Cercospora beticola]
MAPQPFSPHQQSWRPNSQPRTRTTSTLPPSRPPTPATTFPPSKSAHRANHDFTTSRHRNRPNEIHERDGGRQRETGREQAEQAESRAVTWAGEKAGRWANGRQQQNSTSWQCAWLATSARHLRVLMM